MQMIPFHTQGQTTWISQQEATMMGLIPVNLQGQTVHMYPAEANAEGLGLFGSRKAKKAKQQAATASQTFQQTDANLTAVSNALKNAIPAFQADLQRANAELQKEVQRVGASVPIGLAYAGAAAGTGALVYVIVKKILNRRK